MSDFDCCVPVGPDCRDGKHPACDGRAWDDHTDSPTDCRCDCHLRMPPAPPGYVACRVMGVNSTTTHLVELDEHGSNGGRPTACGLTRFDQRENGRPVPGTADLPGWGMGDSGLTGPGVRQIKCAACYRAAHGAPVLLRRARAFADAWDERTDTGEQIMSYIVMEGPPGQRREREHRLTTGMLRALADLAEQGT